MNIHRSYIKTNNKAPSPNEPIYWWWI